MSDLRFNTIAGCALAAVLGVMGLQWGASVLTAPEKAKQAGWAPEVVAGGSAAPAARRETLPPDWGTVFGADVDMAALVATGDRVHGQCVACHTVEAGGAHINGPNLWNIVNRAGGGRVAGYNYSEAMRAHAPAWSYDELYLFLEAPNRHIRGTKMSFGGISRTNDRVALIAYLRTLADSPAPIPPPRPAEAPAEGEATSEGAGGEQTPPAEGAGATTTTTPSR
mgnify:CR=1 FL=1